MKKFFFVFLLFWKLWHLPLDAQSLTRILSIKLHTDVGAASARTLNLGLDYAEAHDFDLVILDLNTFGGAIHNANEMKESILAYKKPIYVFINTNAASAGALLSIACDSIYMVPGASIGAATAVTGTGEAAPDKYQSYMRGMMRSTAKAKNRNPNIAEAMVDENLVVDNISKKGEVITFDSKEAILYGFCDGEVSSIDDLVSQQLNIDNYNITEFELSMVDQIINFFTNTVISGILIMIILGGLYYELQSPGLGFPIVAAVIAAVLYLTPYYLTGLADNWEILLLLAGFTLIALEAFVIPGFGITGILGGILTTLALVLVMVNNDNLDFTYVSSSRLSKVLIVVTVSLGAGLFLAFYFTKKVLMTANISIVNKSFMNSKEGYSAAVLNLDLVGKKGVSKSVLRPSGKVLIEDTIYDAVSQGDFIEKGQPITVMAIDGSRLKVKLDT